MIRKLRKLVLLRLLFSNHRLLNMHAAQRRHPICVNQVRLLLTQEVLSVSAHRHRIVFLAQTLILHHEAHLVDLVSMADIPLLLVPNYLFIKLFVY